MDSAEPSRHRRGARANRSRPGLFHVREAGEALHPEREPLHVLERLRLELGPDIFAAQYQQSPVPPGGAMIKRQWIRYYDVLPPRQFPASVIQSWDTAVKNGAQNDYSVCTTWLKVDKDYTSSIWYGTASTILASKRRRWPKSAGISQM